MAGRDRPRARRVENRSLRDVEAERGEARPVVGNLRGHHHLDPVRRIGPRIGGRDVDPAPLKPRRAGEIDRDLPPADLHPGGEPDRRVIAIGKDLGLINPAREGRDRRLGRPARGGEDALGQAFEIPEAELAEHLGKPRDPRLVAGGERVDVALEFGRPARIGAEEGEERLIPRPLGETAEDRDEEPLLEHRAPLGPHAEPADVDDVRRVGEEGDEAALMKGGAHHGEVVEMAGGEPGVVGDEVIPLAHRLGGIGAEEVADAFRHRVDMPRRAGHRLGDHPSVGGEDPRREIARLAHRGAEGGADHRLRLFLDHGDEPVPHHLLTNA